jgi:hypothetical protein
MATKLYVEPAVFTEESRTVKRNKAKIGWISYNGYDIRPAPLPSADGRWIHEVYVRRDTGYVERKFFSESSSETEEEAIAYCVTYGKKIIDRKVPNCSVADL